MDSRGVEVLVLGVLILTGCAGLTRAVCGRLPAALAAIGVLLALSGAPAAAINGYIFGNLPGLTMATGERVRWYLLGMGEEQDLHTVHWHGQTARFRGRHTDVIELLPGSMAVADMLADNPGTWLLHCHVGDHMLAGMLATYTITTP